MSTPTDPYNSNSRRPFDDEDSVLEPLEDEAADTPEADPATSDGAQVAGEAGQPEPYDVDEASTGLPRRYTGSIDPVFPEPATPREHEPLAPREHEPADAEQAPVSADTPRGPTRTSVMGAATFADSFPAADSYPGNPPAGAPTEQTAATPESPAEAAFMTAASPADAADRRERWSADPGDAVLTDDIPAQPKGRGLTHTLTLLATLLLVPVAWYLIADAGARLANVPNNPWLTGSPQLMPLLELAGGVVVAGIIWWLARASSLGAHVIGTLVFVAGAGALAAPTFAQDLIGRLSNAIGDYNAFTGNVVYHLGNDLATGRIAVFGALLILTGIVSHGARRRGQTFATAVTRRHFLLRES